MQGLMAYRKAESAEAQALILGNLSVRWDLLADAAQGPLVWKANGKYAKRRFGGVVLVSDNESWVYAGRAFASGQQGATGVMTEWQKFVAK